MTLGKYFSGSAPLPDPNYSVHGPKAAREFDGHLGVMTLRMSKDIDIVGEVPHSTQSFRPYRANVLSGQLETQVERGKEDTVDLRVILSGATRRTVASGESMWLSAGNSYVVSSGRQLLLEGFSHVSLYVDTASLKLPKSKKLNEFDASHPMSAILSTSLTEIFKVAQAKQLAVLDQLGNGLVAFAREALVLNQHPEDMRDHAREGLLTAMQAHIEQNLHDPERNLSVTKIAHKFGISRATLYRQFKEFGGYAKYIQNRRVVKACQHLEVSRPGHGAVARVATLFGFDDPSHFNRLVSAYSGTTPSALLGVGLREEGAL